VRIALVTCLLVVAVAHHRAAADPSVTDAEVAAARDAKVGCKDFARARDTLWSRTRIKLLTRACKRDHWPLAAIVCYLRDGTHPHPGCETQLPKAASDRIERALARADATIVDEEAGWLVDQGVELGAIVANTADTTAQTAVITAWAKAALDQCGARDLTIVVTIADHACAGVKITGEHADAATKCLRSSCRDNDWSAVADQSVTIRNQ
jgi:hypothetical protein